MARTGIAVGLGLFLVSLAGAAWASGPVEGGCCIPPSNQCFTFTQQECDSLGGNWDGAGTTCTPAPCYYTYACCFKDGSCTYLSQHDCQAAGGTSQPYGAFCMPGTGCPQLSACCAANGTCSLTYWILCLEQGGTYKGEGSQCTPNTCSPAAAPEPGYRSATWGKVKSTYQ